MRFRHFHGSIGLLGATLCALAACGDVNARHPRDASPTTGDASPTGTADASTGTADASTAPDSGTGTGTGSGSDQASVVTCYSEGAPAATCTLPVHCCFSNYSSQHDGTCTTQSCTYGTITCDGPEDCAAGDVCCAHAITDPTVGTIGYTLACQAGACGSAATDHEICHPDSGCAYGGSCVTAYGNANDLPRTLYICK